MVRAASYSLLTGKRVSVELVEGLLRDVLNEESRFAITIEAIQKRVAEHFDIRVADMTSKRRPENIAFPRQIAMYLSKLLTLRSLPEIGRRFGGRDHTTVLHAVRKIEELAGRDGMLLDEIDLLKRMLLE